MTPIIQSGTHLISSSSRETTKCININGGLIEVALGPRRGFQPLKWLMCGRGSPQPNFTILSLTPQKMTTISHNSSEDVTFLTDERALRAASVRLFQAWFGYTCEDTFFQHCFVSFQGVTDFCVCVCGHLLHAWEVSTCACQNEGQIQQDN